MLKQGDKVKCVHIKDMAINREWKPQVGRTYIVKDVAKSITGARQIKLVEDPFQQLWIETRFQITRNDRNLPEWW